MELYILLASIILSETVAFFFIVKYLIRANHDMFHAYIAKTNQEYLAIKQTENVKPIKEEPVDEVPIESLDDEEFISAIKKQL